MSPLDLPQPALPLGAGDMDQGRIDALRRTRDQAGARRAAAQELEVLFLGQLMQAMRKTIPQSDFLPPSPARTVYEGAFDRAVAGAMAERDPLGLVRTLAPPPALKPGADHADTAPGHQLQGRSTGP